jgi:hypothetical protein
VAKKARGLTAWKSGRPFLLDTAIESYIFQEIFIIPPKNDTYSDSIQTKSVSEETVWRQGFV